ncbi:ice-binding family protein [Ferruginibacter lapsinanis]|uniref:ice-binding family protein n=1 Tax=Ferruginibacter lapsinanis TaxID=563172 RepID=UPI001E61CA2B|nr:ice-binding family protein [Ferruginibacter lapsinanis]UEG50891.1 ice-binding family protein [Ferruginibacter lapsinanis]
MKNNLLTIVACIVLSFSPKINFAQANPLGTAHSFALMTASGNIVNTGTTIVTGNMGTDAGTISGFPPGIVLGQTHNADATTALAAADIAFANNYFTMTNCTNAIGAVIGSNTILTPGVYCVGTSAQLDGDLILNAGNNPNAKFIFKISGNFSTAKYTNIILINEASLENVSWQMSGSFSLGDSSVFMGTVLAGTDIYLSGGASLFGRALSSGGNIILDSNFITTGLTPLVIKLAGIKAVNTNFRNQIEWATETADKGDVFEIERSSDGKNFVQIDRLMAETQTSSYSFWDEHPLTGINYYRLKLTEASGKYSYSPIVTAILKAPLEFSVVAYPNPVINTLTMIIKGTIGKNAVINMTDISGRKIKTIMVKDNRVEINMTSMTTGVYFVKYLDENGSRIVKINKQR